MGGLLNNARRFFQGRGPSASSKPQRYSVACPDGHRLSGLRTDGYQALRCPTCGEGIFVLPRSPLPEPGDPPATTKRPRAAVASSFVSSEEEPVALTDPVMAGMPEEADTDGTIEWVDEGSEEEDVTPEPVPAPRGDPFDAAQAELAESPGKTRVARPRPAGKKAPRNGRPEPERVVLPAPVPFDFGRWARSNRNPLIFAAVLAVVAGTVYIRSWRARLADLPRVAERGKVEGLAALDAGKFDLAYQILSEARAAVNELGDAYQGSSAIRQGADEAEVIAKQVSDPLEQLLEEAGRSDPDVWDDRFRKLYKGRTVIIEAEVTAVPNSQGDGLYDLSYRVLPDGEGGKPRSFGKIDTKGFKHFESLKPRLHDVITFGATLASFKLDPATETWMIGLEPDSGVIMTHHKALEALGWEPLEGDPSAEDR